MPVTVTDVSVNDPLPSGARIIAFEAEVTDGGGTDGETLRPADLGLETIHLVSESYDYTNQKLRVPTGTHRVAVIGR